MRERAQASVETIALTAAALALAAALILGVVRLAPPLAAALSARCPGWSHPPRPRHPSSTISSAPCSTRRRVPLPTARRCSTCGRISAPASPAPRPSGVRDDAAPARRRRARCARRPRRARRHRRRRPRDGGRMGGARASIRASGRSRPRDRIRERARAPSLPRPGPRVSTAESYGDAIQPGRAAGDVVVSLRPMDCAEIILRRTPGSGLAVVARQREWHEAVCADDGHTGPGLAEYAGLLALAAVLGAALALIAGRPSCTPFAPHSIAVSRGSPTGPPPSLRARRTSPTSSPRSFRRSVPSRPMRPCSRSRGRPETSAPRRWRSRSCSGGPRRSALDRRAARVSRLVTARRRSVPGCRDADGDRDVETPTGAPTVVWITVAAQRRALADRPRPPHRPGRGGARRRRGDSDRGRCGARRVRRTSHVACRPRESPARRRPARRSST